MNDLSILGSKNIEKNEKGEKYGENTVLNEEEEGKDKNEGDKEKDKQSPYRRSVRIKEGFYDDPKTSSYFFDCYEYTPGIKIVNIF